MENRLKQIFDHLFTHEANPTTLSRKDFLKLSELGAAVSVTTGFEDRGEVPLGNRIVEETYGVNLDPNYLRFTSVIKVPNKEEMIFAIGGDDIKKHDGDTPFSASRFCEAYLGLGRSVENTELCGQGLVEAYNGHERANVFRFQTTNDGMHVVIGGIARTKRQFKASVDMALMTDTEYSEWRNRKSKGDFIFPWEQICWVGGGIAALALLGRLVYEARQNTRDVMSENYRNSNGGGGGLQGAEQFPDLTLEDFLGGINRRTAKLERQTFNGQHSHQVDQLVQYLNAALRNPNPQIASAAESRLREIKSRQSPHYR